MALPLSNTYEGGSAGTTLTQGSGGNTGGTSGNYFDSVFIGASNALIFANDVSIHGSLVGKYTQNVSATSQAYTQWSSASMGSNAHVMLKFYFQLSHLPTTNGLRPILLLDNTTSVGMVEITTTGNLRAINGTTTGATQGTGTTVSPNTLYRLEVYCKPGAAGTAIMLVNMYAGEGTTIINTARRQVEAGGSVIDGARFGLNTGGAGGITNGTNNFDMWLDDPQVFTPPRQTILPDADTTTTGWTTTPLWSKVNDSSDSTLITATAS